MSRRTWLVQPALFGVLLGGTYAQEVDPRQRQPSRKLLLLAQGPDGHPAATHEYRAGLKLLAHLLRPTPGLELEVVSADDTWEEGPQKLRQADGVVLFLSEGARWMHAEPRRLEAFAQLAARGGGLVVLHWGMGTRDADYIDGFLKLFGGCHGGPDRKYQLLETRLELPDPTHPIVAGVGPVRVRDEFYYRLKFTAAERALKPIVKAEIDGQWETVAWAWERSDGGRSFGFSGLHFHEGWQHVAYRRLVAQAVLWSIKMPIPMAGLKVDVDPAQLRLP